MHVSKYGKRDSKSIRKSYSKVKDSVQIYDVKVKTMETKHDNKIVKEYANHLKAFVNHLKASWTKLDHYKVIKTKCTDDA